MNRREIIVLILLVAGGAMQALAFIGEGSAMLRGLGAVTFCVGIAIEIAGIAILEDGENPRKR